MSPLLNCPFCGGRAEYKQGIYTGYVVCLCCEVMGPNIAEAEAIAAWNRRAPPEQSAAGHPVAVDGGTPARERAEGDAERTP